MPLMHFYNSTNSINHPSTSNTNTNNNNNRNSAILTHSNGLLFFNSNDFLNVNNLNFNANCMNNNNNNVTVNGFLNSNQNFCFNC